MRYFFIVQGEGREHLMEAMALERMLQKDGHEVVEIMVGTSARRKVPEWFKDGVRAPVSEFTGVNLMSSRRASFFRRVLNSVALPVKYTPSLRRIRGRVRSAAPDAVVNFHELLYGLACRWCRIRVPHVWIGRDWLSYVSKVGSRGAVKRLVISRSPLTEYRRRRIRIIPPILRPEILSLRNEDGTPGPGMGRGYHILGYLPGPVPGAQEAASPAGGEAQRAADAILRLHREHPETPLHIFWDRWSAGETYSQDSTLTWHLFDLDEFTRLLTDCGAYIDLGRFEPLCEAMYLGKPILSCDFSHFPTDSGEGSPADPLGGLISPDFSPDVKFITWVRAAEKILLTELTTGLTRRRKKRKTSRRP